MKQISYIALVLLLLLFGCANTVSDEQTTEEITTQATEPAVIVASPRDCEKTIETEPVINMESPPVLQIVTAQEERYEVNYLSCMWECDGMTWCVDTLHPLQIKQISPLFNAENIDYSLWLEIEPFTEDYSVTCWDIESQDVVETILDYESNRIDLDPRLTKECVFEVAVEYPQGTATYCFGVEFAANNSAVIDEAE